MLEKNEMPDPDSEEGLSQVEQCHDDGMCSNCGGEVDNPLDGCECPCHQFV